MTPALYQARMKTRRKVRGASANRRLQRCMRMAHLTCHHVDTFNRKAHTRFLFSITGRDSVMVGDGWNGFGAERGLVYTLTDHYS